MIEIRGTSHIASDDLSEIQKLVAERQPDVVALELDENRLQALLGEVEQRRSLNPFFFVLKLVQDVLGKRTGAMPGADMLAAFQAAIDQGCDVVLIDQDITVTLRKLKQVSLVEKIKFFGFLIVGAPLLTVRPVNLQDVPDDHLVQKLLLQFEISFPQMYDVLVTERNEIMAERLRALDGEYDDVLAFVGAGHTSGIHRLLTSAS